MPTITNPGVIQRLAEAYIRLDGNKSGALADVGYAKNYARAAKGMRLFERSDVKNAIDRLQEEIRAKTGWTIERAQSHLLSLVDQAEALKQPSAGVSAVVAINRMHGLDKDNNVKDAVQIVIIPPNSPKRAESKVIDNE